MKLLSAHAARDNGQPFFLNVNPYGPHIAQYTHPEMIDRRRTGWWLEMVQPYSPDYNEVDTSDKRGFFGPLPDMPDWARAFTNVRHRERALACRSVDDMVGEIEETLTSLGLDDNTYIIITSDNGFQLGHHRTIGKGLPTDRSTRVPLFVKGPNVPVDVTANHLIGHIDLAPTIVKLAGGTTPDFVDGASFSSLLTQDGLDTYPTFRQGLLIENWASLSGFAVKSDAASKSLRTIDTVYTEWANGEKDFFNLTYDPYQLYNVYDNLAPVHKDFFAGWLRLLQSEDSRPQVRFSQPHASGQRIARNLPLRGLAEHSSNLIAVKLGIYSHQRNQFWNGTNWQAGFAQVDAELENPNSLLTFWNYRSMPTGLNSVNGNLSVWAWSYSPGKCSEAGLVTFSYDIGTE